MTTTASSTGRAGRRARSAMGTRFLIVNADDFGRSAGVNRGVIAAHEQGIVTSASLMVRWPAGEEAAAYARAHPALDVGLHVDLSEWNRRNGDWTQAYEVVPLDDAQAVAAEVACQLERFRRLVGRDPTHVDAHQNVDRAAPVDAVLLDLALELGVPLRNYSGEIHSCGTFYGQTSRGYPYPEGISAEALLRILDGLERGVTELRCHPGEPGEWDTSYAAERALEVEALCHARVRRALVARRIQLVGFGDLAGRVSVSPAALERSFRQRGTAAYEAEDYDQAEAWFRRATVARDSAPWPWLWLARAQLKLGKRKGSLASVRRALVLQPDWAHALLHLADLLLLERESAVEGLALLERVHLTHPDDPDVLRRVARRLLHLKDYPAALRAANTLLQIRPADEDGLVAKAVATWRLGDPEAAAAVIGTRVTTLPPPAARAAAQLYLEIGDPLTAWQALEPLADGDLNRRLLATIAQALRTTGRLEAARAAYARAATLDPDDDRVRFWLDVTAGETTVLGGAWTPAEPRTGALRPTAGRVLHLVGKSVPHFQSGFTVRTHYVARAQREVGLDAHVVTQLGFPWDQGVKEASLSEEVDGVVYHRLAAREGLPVRIDDRLSLNVEELAPLVRRLRPAVLHAASDFQNALLARELARRFGLPFVYEARGFWEETWVSKLEGRDRSSDGYRWRCERELQCMLEADRVVTLGEAMKAELVGRGVPGERIVVVPNAVDVDAFVPLERDPELASRLGIEPAETVLGYISSFIAYEGIEYLLEAVAVLAARGHRVRALLVGDGEERQRLESRAAELDLGDRVVFAGRIPHDRVPAYYGLIDVFVVPRRADRVCRLVTPLKPFEAMATARVLAVSGLEALREIVEDGHTGVVFSPEDPVSLADVVEPLLDDPERRRAIGAAAREWVSTHRTWSANGRRYLELYHELGVA